MSKAIITDQRTVWHRGDPGEDAAKLARMIQLELLSDGWVIIECVVREDGGEYVRPSVHVVATRKADNVE